MVGWRCHVIPLVLLLLSIFVPYHRLILGLDYLSAGDLVNETYVWKEFLVQSLERGDFPLWYPRAFCGSLFAANVQSGCFYLPEYIVFLTGVFCGFSLLTVAHLFLAGAAVYGIAWRSLGERWSSLIAAVVFVHGGTTVFDAGGGMARNLFPLAWLLVGLWFLFRWIDGRGIGSWAGLVLAVGMTWVCGSPQFVMYAFYLFAAVSGWEFLARRPSSTHGRPGIRERLPPLLGFLTAFGMGTALAAVQVIPLFVLSPYIAGRGGGGSFQFATIGSYPPAMLPTLIYPFLYGDSSDNTYWATATGYKELAAYVGAVSVLLAVFGLLSSRIRSKNLWIVLGAGAVLIAFGSYTPFYRIPYHLLPGFGQMRVPARVLFLTVLVLAIFTGAGFRSLFVTRDGVARDPAALRRGLRITIVALGILLTLAVIVTFGRGWVENTIQATWEARVVREMDRPLSPDDVAQASPRILTEARTDFLLREMLRPLFWGGIFLFVLFLAYRAPSAVWTAVLVALLLYADLLVFGCRFIETAPAKDFRVTHYPLEPELAKLKALQRDAAPSRYVQLDDLIGWVGRERFPALRPNRPQVHGLCGARGLDPLIMSHYSRYFYEMQNDEDPDRFPHGALSLPDLPPEYRAAFARLACPFVLTIHRLEGFQPLSEGVVLLYEFEDALPRAFVITGDDIEDGVTAARITDWSADRVVVEGEIESGGRLVLVETWYPGWKVSVNGGSKTAAEMWEAFRAISVPPGTFRARFDFEPADFRAGLLVSCISFILCVGICWSAARGRKRRLKSSPPGAAEIPSANG